MLYTRSFLLANLVNVLALSAINFFLLLPLYLTRQGCPEWEVGLVMGAFNVSAVLVRPPLGHAMDAVGRRLFMLAGLGGGMLCAALFLVVGTVPWLLAGVRVLQGACFAVYITAICTWAADHAPPGRMAEALGVFGVSGLVTMALGTAVGERIVAAGGYPALFAGASLALGVAGALAFGLPELHRPPSEVHHNDSFVGMARRAALLSSNVTVFVFSAGVFSVATFVGPHLHQGSVSGFFAVYCAAAIVTRLAVGPMADRAGRGAVVIPALLTMGAGILLLGAGQSGLAAVLIGTGHGTAYPTLNALLLDRVTSMERGKATSLFMASSDLGGFLGTSACGAVASAVGLAPMFGWLGVFVLGGSVLFLALEKRWGQDIDVQS